MSGVGRGPSPPIRPSHVIRAGGGGVTEEKKATVYLWVCGQFGEEVGF